MFDIYNMFLSCIESIFKSINIKQKTASHFICEAATIHRHQGALEAILLWSSMGGSFTSLDQKFMTRRVEICIYYARM